jgi:hypothetical protein
MKKIKQPSFREIRQPEKIAQRRADALAIKQGVDPAIIQQQNSIFKENPFSNAPIKRNGRVVAI